MMETSQARRGDHGRVRCRPFLDRASVRGVFLQGVVNTVLVVVVHVIADQPPEMLLVQCDDMVQHLAPGTSDPPFRYSILPGRLDARPFWFQTRRLQKRNHVSVEFQIAVHDRVAIRTGLGKRFA